MRRGLLLVASGASGTGKGTVCRAMLQEHPEIRLSVSATTRKPRAGEVDGESYFFLTQETFREMIDRKEFIEWACFCNNYYGTPRKAVEEQLAAGHDVILEIEVQGAMQVKSKFPEAVFIFITPPSLEELRNRIVGRGTETEDVINQRMETARQEFTHMEKYNYILLNDDIDSAVKRFAAIIEAEKMRTERSAETILKYTESK